jgi:hypothetical protein
MTTEDRPFVSAMCENLVAAQQISPISRASDEHEKHTPSDDPWLTCGAYVLCAGFSDIGMMEGSACSGRCSRSAKARSRGRLGSGRAASSMGIVHERRQGWHGQQRRMGRASRPEPGRCAPCVARSALLKPFRGCFGMSITR